MDYADSMLKDAEDQVKKYMTAIEEQHKNAMDFYNQLIDVIYDNRQQLRGR
jgi:hypothetical protein